MQLQHQQQLRGEKQQKRDKKVARDRKPSRGAADAKPSTADYKPRASLCHAAVLSLVHPTMLTPPALALLAGLPPPVARARAQAHSAFFAAVVGAAGCNDDAPVAEAEAVSAAEAAVAKETNLLGAVVAMGRGTPLQWLQALVAAANAAASANTSPAHAATLAKILTNRTTTAVSSTGPGSETLLQTLARSYAREPPFTMAATQSRLQTQSHARSSSLSPVSAAQSPVSAALTALLAVLPRVRESLAVALCAVVAEVTAAALASEVSKVHKAAAAMAAEAAAAGMRADSAPPVQYVSRLGEKTVALLLAFIDSSLGNKINGDNNDMDWTDVRSSADSRSLTAARRAALEILLLNDEAVALCTANHSSLLSASINLESQRLLAQHEAVASLLVRASFTLFPAQTKDNSVLTCATAAPAVAGARLVAFALRSPYAERVLQPWLDALLPATPNVDVTAVQRVAVEAAKVLRALLEASAASHNNNMIGGGHYANMPQWHWPCLLLLNPSASRHTAPLTFSTLMTAHYARAPTELRERLAEVELLLSRSAAPLLAAVATTSGCARGGVTRSRSRRANDSLHELHDVLRALLRRALLRVARADDAKQLLAALAPSEDNELAHGSSSGSDSDSDNAPTVKASDGVSAAAVNAPVDNSVSADKTAADPAVADEAAISAVNVDAVPVVGNTDHNAALAAFASVIRSIAESNNETGAGATLTAALDAYVSSTTVSRDNAPGVEPDDEDDDDDDGDDSDYDEVNDDSNGAAARDSSATVVASRVVATPTTVSNLDRLLVPMRSGVHLIVEGETGQGKSELVLEAARQLNLPCERVNLSATTSRDTLFGRATLHDGGRFCMTEGPFLRAYRTGAVLLLDELNLAQDAVLQSIEAALDPTVTVYTLPHEADVFVGDDSTQAQEQRGPNPNSGRAKGGYGGCEEDEEEPPSQYEWRARVERHPSFRMVCTQNPAGSRYSRQSHSDAFRNHFTTISFDSYSAGDLQMIAAARLAASWPARTQSQTWTAALTPALVAAGLTQLHRAVLAALGATVPAATGNDAAAACRSLRAVRGGSRRAAARAVAEAVAAARKEASRQRPVPSLVHEAGEAYAEVTLRDLNQLCDGFMAMMHRATPAMLVVVNANGRGSSTASRENDNAEADDNEEHDSDDDNLDNDGDCVATNAVARAALQLEAWACYGVRLRTQRGRSLLATVISRFAQLIFPVSDTDIADATPQKTLAALAVSTTTLGDDTSIGGLTSQRKPTTVRTGVTAGPYVYSTPARVLDKLDALPFEIYNSGNSGNNSNSSNDNSNVSSASAAAVLRLTERQRVAWPAVRSLMVSLWQELRQRARTWGVVPIDLITTARALLLSLDDGVSDASNSEAGAAVSERGKAAGWFGAGSRIFGNTEESDDERDGLYPSIASTGSNAHRRSNESDEDEDSEEDEEDEEDDDTLAALGRRLGASADVDVSDLAQSDAESQSDSDADPIIIDDEDEDEDEDEDGDGDDDTEDESDSVSDEDEDDDDEDADNDEEEEEEEDGIPASVAARKKAELRKPRCKGKRDSASVSANAASASSQSKSVSKSSSASGRKTKSAFAPLTVPLHPSEAQQQQQQKLKPHFVTLPQPVATALARAFRATVLPCFAPSRHRVLQSLLAATIGKSAANAAALAVEAAELDAAQLVPPVQLDLEPGVFAGLVRAAALGQPLLLSGPAASGKTSLLCALTFLTSGLAPEEVFLTRQSEPEDLIGHHSIAKGKRLIWVNGAVTRAAEAGLPCLLHSADLAPATVLERLNPIMESPPQLKVHENSESTPRQPAEGFLIAAFVTTAATDDDDDGGNVVAAPFSRGGGHGSGISPAFYNRCSVLHLGHSASVEGRDAFLAAVTEPYLDGRRSAAALKDLLPQWARVARAHAASVVSMRTLCFTVRAAVAAVPALLAFPDRSDGDTVLWRAHVFLAGSLFVRATPALRRAWFAGYKRSEVAAAAAHCLACYPTFLWGSNWGSPTSSYTQCGTALNLAALACLARAPLLLEGDAAAGKTALARHLASIHSPALMSRDNSSHNHKGDDNDDGQIEDESDALVRAASVLERFNNSKSTRREDYFGSFVPADAGQFAWVSGPLTRALSAGGVFLADEFNLCPSDVMNCLAPVLQPGACPVTTYDEVTHAPVISRARPSFLFLATQNPAAMRGRSALPVALLERFALIPMQPYVTTQLAEIARNIVKTQLNFFTAENDGHDQAGEDEKENERESAVVIRSAGFAPCPRPTDPTPPYSTANLLVHCLQALARAQVSGAVAVRGGGSGADGAEAAFTVRFMQRWAARFARGFTGAALFRDSESLVALHCALRDVPFEGDDADDDNGSVAFTGAAALLVTGFELATTVAAPGDESREAVAATLARAVVAAAANRHESYGDNDNDHNAAVSAPVAAALLVALPPQVTVTAAGSGAVLSRGARVVALPSTVLALLAQSGVAVNTAPQTLLRPLLEAATALSAAEPTALIGPSGVKTIAAEAALAAVKHYSDTNNILDISGLNSQTAASPFASAANDLGAAAAGVERVFLTSLSETHDLVGHIHACAIDAAPRALATAVHALAARTAALANTAAVSATATGAAVDSAIEHAIIAAKAAANVEDIVSHFELTCPAGAVDDTVDDAFIYDAAARASRFNTNASNKSNIRGVKTPTRSDNSASAAAKANAGAKSPSAAATAADASVSTNSVATSTTAPRSSAKKSKTKYQDDESSSESELSSESSCETDDSAVQKSVA